MQTFAKNTGEIIGGDCQLALGWSDSILRLSRREVFFLFRKLNLCRTVFWFNFYLKYVRSSDMVRTAASVDVSGG